MKASVFASSVDCKSRYHGSGVLFSKLFSNILTEFLLHFASFSDENIFHDSGRAQLRGHVFQQQCQAGASAFEISRHQLRHLHLVLPWDANYPDEYVGKCGIYFLGRVPVERFCKEI